MASYSALGSVMTPNPFELNNDLAYQRWRDLKLSHAPRSMDDLIIEVRDPRRLTETERMALVARCQSANMAIYAGPDYGEDRTVPRLLGAQIGLLRLDHNRGADEDDITALRVVQGENPRADFIPYTNRALHWHTDGYYNSPERQIHGFVLHCVRPAKTGGANSLLDPELAYIFLRDLDPGYIYALSAADAMTIPAYMRDGREERPASIGPIFSITADGHLHLRYTARARNILWRKTPVIFPGKSTREINTQDAVAALNQILTTTPYVLHGTLTSGQGLITNNVLHDRSEFTDDPSCSRLIYRARSYDRVRQS